jgi:hypothetical protein
MNECTHIEGKGMCRNCCPEMFPSVEQENAYAEWFRQYRAFKAGVLPIDRCYMKRCRDEATETGRCVQHERQWQLLNQQRASA